MPVLCPPLVPSGGVVADPGLYGFEGPLLPDRAGDFYLLTFNNGDNPGHIHWIVGAGRGHTVQTNLFDPRQWDVPGHTGVLGQRRYGPWTITFYRFPPHPSGGPLGGHDLALTKVADTTYFATVHGHTHHDADAAMLLAILLKAGVFTTPTPTSPVERLTNRLERGAIRVGIQRRGDANVIDDREKCLVSEWPA